MEYLEHTDDVCVDLTACHGTYGPACMAQIRSAKG